MTVGVCMGAMVGVWWVSGWSQTLIETGVLFVGRRQSTSRWRIGFLSVVLPFRGDLFLHTEVTFSIYSEGTFHSQPKIPETLNIRFLLVVRPHRRPFPSSQRRPFLVLTEETFLVHTEETFLVHKRRPFSSTQRRPFSSTQRRPFSSSPPH